MDSLNYISVSESARREITATGARLAVRIAGQAFFTGREAFKKAAEVCACVAGLSENGIGEEHVQIKNVSTQVDSGFLTKSSSATYDLEVTCDSMELLGPAVATISSLKNSELLSIAWKYSNVDEVKREVLQEAVRSSKDSADAIVSALNASLAGVHRLKYEISGLNDELKTARASRARIKSKSSKSDFEIVSDSLRLSHTATVVANVVAEFLVASE